MANKKLVQLYVCSTLNQNTCPLIILEQDSKSLGLIDVSHKPANAGGEEESFEASLVPLDQSLACAPGNSVDSTTMFSDVNNRRLVVFCLVL